MVDLGFILHFMALAAKRETIGLLSGAPVRRVNGGCCRAGR